MENRQNIVEETKPLNSRSIAVIKLLQTDGRITTRELAQTLSTTEITVRKYLKHMRESGIVNISATLNPHKVGYGLEIVLHLRVNPQHLKTVGQILSELPEVRYLVITSGAYSVLCVVALQDAAEFTKFLNDKVWVLEGLGSVDTTLMLEPLKRPDKWLPFLEASQPL